MIDNKQSKMYDLFVQSLRGKKSDERYATDLLTWSQKLVKAGILEKTAYDCESISEFDEFEKRFKSSEQYTTHKKERKATSPNSGLVIDAAISNYRKFLESDFFLKNRKSNMIINLSPLILYGPPGTGKTYRMQHDFIDKFAKEDSFVTTLHQSFSYEEFVEGLKPVLSSVNNTDGTSSDVKYTIEKGIFYKACERAAELAGYSSLQECVSASDRKAKMQEAIDSHKIVLLCIDEINRANVSAVFGDLISLIEPSKRLGAENEMIVSLPYSKEAFAVPVNLMIVGTMNTADRSIQLLDSALRRRFRFEELLPDYSKIDNSTAREILQKINARIRCLLNKDHQIGHSYFIDAKTDLDIFGALNDCVIPLLEEYFYNDTQKIRQILNEKDDSESNFYVKDDEAEEASSGMQSDFDDDKEFYQLNPKLSEVKDDAVAAQFLTHITAKTAE